MRTSRSKRIHLTPSEHEALRRLLRTGRTGLWQAARARAVLLAAEGQSIAAIARHVARDRKWVRHWIGRFREERLAGLRDAPRSGRPPTFSPGRAA
jgi:transposase-like protein